MRFFKSVSVTDDSALDKAKAFITENSDRRIAAIKEEGEKVRRNLLAVRAERKAESEATLKEMEEESKRRSAEFREKLFQQFPELRGK